MWLYAVREFLPPNEGENRWGHQWNITTTKYGQEIPYDGIIGVWPEDHFWPINEPKTEMFRQYAINYDVLSYK